MKRLALALALFCAFVAAPLAQERPQDPRIDDIIKQIDDLKKQVEELRRGPAQAPAAKPAAPPAGAVLPDAWVKAFTWRSIGPAGMGGRITALAVVESDPTTYWVATASGGLLKTSNNGVTFEHQFDREATVSIGDVCVAPSDPKIVWIGTGEANPRNSVSYGDGVYKSLDGGKTWSAMGLKETYQIGRIVVHPTNPDIVYVGALGRLYGPNKERGLFKTLDGGKTWEKILFVDERTGVVDVTMHPNDPETLIVATWERRRDEFDSHPGDPPIADGYDRYDPITKWGPGSGIHKTTDGGKTFRRLTQGLPTCALGRIDVDYYRRNPDVLWAIVDSEKVGLGPAAPAAYLGAQVEDGGGGAKLTRVEPESPAARAELKPGDVVKSVDEKPTGSAAALTQVLRDRAPGQTLKLEVARGEETLKVEVTLAKRPLGESAAAAGSGYMGIQGEDAGDGARLTQIIEGGPAEKAGLKEGDRVTEVGGKPVADYNDLVEAIRDRRPGDRLQLKVVREDKTIELGAVLAARPSGQGSSLNALLGADGENAESGVKLASLVDDRPAQKAGLEEGDIVRTVDGAPVGDASKLADLLRRRAEGDVLALGVQRGEQTLEIRLTLEAAGGRRARPFTMGNAGQQANAQNRQGPEGAETGGVYRSADGGETWTRINSLNPRPMYFSQIRVDPSDENFVYVLGVSLHRSKDGGKTFTADGARNVHADHHALWINPRDGRHMIDGNDGGFCVTYDRGATWEHLNHMAIGQFYHAAVDTRRPYRVYGGLQDNGSWGGPSRSLDNRGPLNPDWFSVGGGDGFVCRVDPHDPDWIYSESQDGMIGRRNLRTGQFASIRPRPPRGARYRFNWNTPFLLSAHNAGIFYSAGNVVFRSVKRGDDLRPISPEIARTGRGTASALAESPLNPEVLWVGTDDGFLWVTQNGGGAWTNVAEKVGLPGPRWVATIEPSRFVEGRCYVAFDGHRSDDDDPILAVTEDFGKTWKSIRANLPRGSTRCLREDPVNPNLLFAGTEFAVWVSLDRGANWTRLNNNLPTVAVHELAIHPTAGEMVAATHGRSLWVLDITPLRGMTGEALAAPATLYEPNGVTQWRSEPSRAVGGGNKGYAGENPPRGAAITYSLAQKPQKIALKIVDHAGKTVRELRAKSDVGLNVVRWDLTGAAARPTAGPGGRAGMSGFRGLFAGGALVPPGLYRVVLSVDGKDQAQTLRVEPDPVRASGPTAADQPRDSDWD
jgi:S1-C subfamily serine protease/photosystem II stability/assembly factor-like uncharacterized protein